MLGMAAIISGIAIDQARMYGRPLVAVGFGIMAAWLWIAFIRAFMLGVYLRSNGVVVRNFGRTAEIGWGQIDSIGVDRQNSGAAGIANSKAPVIVWRRSPDAAPQTTELSALGGYGLRAGPTLAQRAAAELYDHWKEWKAATPE
jgi:hypothetical protein